MSLEGRDLLEIASRADSSWLDRVLLSEFALLNAHWAGPITSLQDVLSVFEQADEIMLNVVQRIAAAWMELDLLDV